MEEEYYDDHQDYYEEGNDQEFDEEVYNEDQEYENPPQK